MASHTPRREASEGTNPADTLVSGSQPADLPGDRLWAMRPASSVTAATNTSPDDTASERLRGRRCSGCLPCVSSFRLPGNPRR